MTEREPRYDSAESVLSEIAAIFECPVDDIEQRMRAKGVYVTHWVPDQAQRLLNIRTALNTEEAASVIDRARIVMEEARK